MIAALKKELKILFSQPLIYIIAAVFSLIAGILFYSLLLHYIGNVQDQLNQVDSAHKLQLITSQLIFPIIGNINFLMMILAPAMVMNAFSDEYRNGTFSLLVHSAMSPWSFIMAKFLANVMALIFVLSTISIFPLILWYAGIYEYSFLFLGFMVIILNFAFFASIGLWCSSLTSYPVLAMFMTYAIILFHWLFPALKELTNNLWWMGVLDYVSCSKHFESIAKGNVQSFSLGFYGIQIFLFLSLARLSWSKKLLP
jgi:ABC-2 type transport system permease protein